MGSAVAERGGCGGAGAHEEGSGGTGAALNVILGKCSIPIVPTWTLISLAGSGLYYDGQKIPQEGVKHLVIADTFGKLP
jgi:hypothetical protein